MTSPGRVLFSLQTKLILAFVLVVLVALVVAGSIFVVIRRGEQEDRALDRVIAASPSVYAYFFLLQDRDARNEDLVEYVNTVAATNDARVLLVDRKDAKVLVDSGGDLAGEQLVIPEELSVARSPTKLQPYLAWEPENGTPGDNLILVSEVAPQEVRRLVTPRAERFWLLLGVPQSTIADAWQGLLRGLVVAALIALPVAVLLGILVSRYITRPLHQLTVASQRMAEGNFDVAVSVHRQDEMGRLAQAFSAMATRVGEAHAQMRQLVANVSHDLKTPLTSILGFAQALRDGRSTDQAEARRMGAVIYDEASRLTDRLNDLLYLSEIEAGQIVVEREEIDLRRLLDTAAGRIEPEVAGRRVQLDVSVPEGAILSADGAKLERVVENLLDNARKYTPEGGAIHVRGAVDSGTTTIEVSNTTRDLSEEDVPHLFERFYRRDRARATSNGTGLGLPIARDLVELHGGTLEGALRNGELSFTIRLPTTGTQAPA
jgi:signal transduction histidine kinase